MNQPNAQNPLNQTIREDERVLGIPYERAVAMIPRLVRETSGAAPETLGDGYFVARMKDTGKRELTVRLGRQGPDTRFTVRVETLRQLPLLFILIAVVTLGIGVLVLLPWMMSLARKEARARDLLVHNTFRAIEDAVAEQGAGSHYRVAPGADAALPDSAVPAAVPAAAESDADASGELATLRDGRRSSRSS